VSRQGGGFGSSGPSDLGPASNTTDKPSKFAISQDGRIWPTKRSQRRSCPWCKGDFTQVGHGDRRKYCSPTCQHAALAEYRRCRTRVRQCVVCGKDFRRVLHGDAGLCCGRTCGWKLLKQRVAQRPPHLKPSPIVRLPPTPKLQACSQCGVTYEFHKRPFCSQKCSWRASHPHPIQHCRNCGVQLPWGRPKYCETCAPKIAKQISRAKRRVHLREAFREPVFLREIWLRDGGVCHLCRKPVPLHLKVPKFLAPTLDHLTPLSRGGLHERANIALAHFICNSTRGARALDVA